VQIIVVETLRRSVTPRNIKANSTGKRGVRDPSLQSAITCESHLYTRRLRHIAVFKREFGSHSVNWHRPLRFRWNTSIFPWKLPMVRMKLRTVRLMCRHFTDVCEGVTRWPSSVLELNSMMTQAVDTQSRLMVLSRERRSQESSTMPN